MKIRTVLACLLAITFILLFLHTAWEKSPTWDEVGYLGLGGYLLKSGHWDVPAACSHPPLAYYIHALPAFFYPIDWHLWPYSEALARDIRFLRSADFKRGNRLLLDPRYKGEQFLFYSRATSLLFAALLFFLLYRWSHQLHGPQASLLTLLLFALSPNILAHAPLITTDFPLTATFFLAVYTFRRLLLQPSAGRLGLAALSLGLALLSKLSALILLPVLGLLLLWFIALATAEQKRALGALFCRPLNPLTSGLLLYLTLLLPAALVLWSGYGFRLEPYLLTLRSQLWDVSTGHEAYLMGAFSSEGWWHYFPLAFLIKTPLPTLLLGGLGLVYLCRERRPAMRLELGFLLLPPLLLGTLFVLSGSKNIGLRYLLPAYPFLFVIAAGALPLLSASRSAKKRGYLVKRLLLAGLCLFYAVGAVRIHPHHLAYFNELIGGPENGYRYLVDSNLDWGQDLKGLKAYMDERAIDRIKLSYFGTVDPALYQLDYEWLPSYVLPHSPQTKASLPASGLIAISATNLVGVYMDGYGHGKQLFGWLGEYDPIARIGYSIFVYDIPEPR